MDGYRGRDYYTKQEFKDACVFNYWYGAIFGVVGVLALQALFVWYKGWI